MGLYIKDEYKKFVDLLDFSRRKYSIGQVFEDFLYMSAIAIKNSCDFNKNEEDWYLSIVKKYEKQEVNVFPKLLAELVWIIVKDDRFRDVLGEIYQAINSNSKVSGQFFTPNHIAEVMAKMIIDKASSNDGVIKINDPACGSGVLLLNVANSIKDKNLDYSKKLLVYGQDIDIRCFCMTYIQLSLAGIPGIVILGNSLLNEQRKIYYTPQYVKNCLEQNYKNIKAS